MKEIRIEVSATGEVKIETTGFTGESCIEESAFLKEILGRETHRMLVPAYYDRGKIEKKKYLNLCG